MRILGLLILTVSITVRVATASTSWIVQPQAGRLQLDSHLHDYRWDVNGSSTWGLQTWLQRDAWGVGVRGWQAATTQATGVPGETREPRVTLRGLSLSGRRTLARPWGLEVSGGTQVGWLHVSYSPDHLQLDVLGDGNPVEVNFAPIDEWLVAAEVGVSRPLTPRLALGLHLERSYFWLTTNHRDGTDIEERRERFGHWALRAQVSWQIWSRKNATD